METTREIVLALRSTFQRDVAALVVQKLFGAEALVTSVAPEAIASPRDVDEILARCPYAVILPLTLPRFMSLFFAELAHLRRLTTKLLLWSGTKAPGEVVTPLFDEFLAPPVDPMALQRALMRPARRARLDADDVRRAISGILSTAHCFWQPVGDRGSARPPNYGEYLGALEDSDHDYRGPKSSGAPQVSQAYLWRILVVFANPRGSDALRLANEERVIKECIRLSKYRAQLQIRTCPAANVKDLQRALLDEGAEIVQFSGHGTENGLVFEDENGHSHVPPMDAIAGLLLDFAPPLQCAIFNACYSERQGRALSAKLPCTIVTERAISDDVAIEYCRGFYDAIGAGKAVAFAHTQGCRAVVLAGRREDECPVICEA